MTKQQLRSRLLSKLRRQPQQARLARSLKIVQKLRRSKLYQEAKTLLCYVAFDGEVETRALLIRAIADGKRVAVPIALQGGRLTAAEIRDPERDLIHRGLFGIPQPARPWKRIRPEELDLVVVPGLAFDLRGRRLGRGGGYFDRLLAKVPLKVPRVGLAFRFQMVREIPWETHDQPVSKVIRESSR